MRRSLSRRQFLKHSALVALGGPSMVIASCSSKKDFDILIRDGVIFDGVGREGFAGDLGIKDGRIAAVGDLERKSAERVIAARGMAVCPGFIDFHSHSDEDLLIDSRAESKIRQGVTTEVIGQDGDSMAPLTEAMRTKMDEDWRKDYGTIVDWTDFAGYFSRLEARHMAVNIISMVGQGTLRACVIGEDNKPATGADIAAMQDLAKQAFLQGAYGISSGLEYTPGSFASTEEIIELCKAMEGRGIYSTHMRNEDDFLLEAVDEAIRIAQESGVALNISHLKASGAKNWHKVPELLAKLFDASASGLKLTCDRYPYIAYNTGLSSLFPLWSREGGIEKFVERLNIPVLREQLDADVAGEVEKIGGWQSVMISSLQKNPQRENYEGKTLAELTQDGSDPFQLLVDLIIQEEGEGSMVGFGMNEEELSTILAFPPCMVASDGSALALDGPLHKGNPHPRSYGTFPRALAKYARDEEIFTLAECIRKITSLPAATLGLVDRGKLEPGMWADVVVFDPDGVNDRATWQQPHQYPEGIPFVIVNGEIVIDRGEHTGALPGMVLRAPFVRQEFTRK
jgi:N-acyl-D-amino-acid deacylase